MHKHQPSISSTRTNDEGLDGAVPPASVFLFVAHPIIASTTATPTPPTHSLTFSLTLTLTPTLTLTLTPTPIPTPHTHPHTSRLHCLFSSPSPSPSVSCDVVGDFYRRSFYGPGRPPNHLSYTHLLSPQPSGTAHHLSPSDVTPVLHVATYYCYYYYYYYHDYHQPPPPPTPALLLTTLSFQIPTRLGVGGQARQPPCYRCYCCHCCCWLLRAVSCCSTYRIVS